jgi:hypothetical protein
MHRPVRLLMLIEAVLSKGAHRLLLAFRPFEVPTLNLAHALLVFSNDDFLLFRPVLNESRGRGDKAGGFSAHRALLVIARNDQVCAFGFPIPPLSNALSCPSKQTRGGGLR